jgi:hypothetical protein
MAAAVCPRETPGARLNARVTAGKRPSWLMIRGEVEFVVRVKAFKGTEPPFSVVVYDQEARISSLRRSI